MKKFLNHYHEPLNYLREQEIESYIWYEIRDNLLKWYIEAFAEDSIGIDILVSYVRKMKKIEEAKEFFENMTKLVLFEKLGKEEQEQVRKIAKTTFIDGLFYIEKEYLLNMIEKNLLNKLIKENILVEDERKLRFQNILLLTYLAAVEINKEQIEINDNLFEHWLENAECEYFNNQNKILYIFYIINQTKFNMQYLKPKLDRFLGKIDASSEISIAQSMIDSQEITEKLGEEYPTVFLGIEEDYSFLSFLGICIDGTTIDYNKDKYRSTLLLKYLNEKGEIVIDYTKAKEDRILRKILDEEGIIAELVKNYKYLKKVQKELSKNPSGDYCDDWEIKGLTGYR